MEEEIVYKKKKVPLERNDTITKGIHACLDHPLLSLPITCWFQRLTASDGRRAKSGQSVNGSSFLLFQISNVQQLNGMERESAGRNKEIWESREMS